MLFRFIGRQRQSCDGWCTFIAFGFYGLSSDVEFFFFIFLHGSPNTRPLKKYITINVRVAWYKWFRTRHVVESERSPAKQTHSPYNRESFNFSGEWFWVENFYNMLLVLILYYGYSPWNVLYFNPTSMRIFFLLQKTDATLLRRRRIRRQTERILLLGFVILFDKGDECFFFFCTNKFHKRLIHLKYINKLAYLYQWSNKIHYNIT